MGPGPTVGTSDMGETEYGDSSSPAGQECSRIEVKPTENGGFAVQCFYKPKTDRGPKDRSAPNYEPSDYAFSSFDELVGWMKDELGASSGSDGSAAASADAPAGAGAGA